MALSGEPEMEKLTYIEGGVLLAVGVEVTPVRVTGSGISVCRKCASAVVALASLLADSSARVRSVRSADLVGLPDIHF